MAYDNTRGLMYQVSVENAGSNIIIWNPNTCEYCVAYGPSEWPSQRAIAYDPGEDVIYVGGWNSEKIYKCLLPPCNDTLYVIDSCDLSGTPFSTLSGLAWDDIDGGLYAVNSSNNQLGKIDFNTCTVLYYGDISWIGPGPSWSPAAAGIAFSPEEDGIYATVFDINSGLSAINFFLRPEDDDVDPFSADTGCLVDSSFLAWGIGQEDGFPCEAWISNYYTLMEDHELVPCPPTSVKEKSRWIRRHILSSYPNPFTGSTEITFTLRKSGRVTMDIYNASGRLVKNLINKNLTAGTHTVIWDAKNLPSGIYFYKLATKDWSVTKKVALLR